jgi:hypothetical protein
MANEQLITKDNNDDGIDRTGFIKCMAWAGIGILWMMSGDSFRSTVMISMLGAAASLATMRLLPCQFRQ